METLTLNLIGKWYNLIESGEKKEEYRAIKDFWASRLFNRDEWKLFVKENKNEWLSDEEYFDDDTIADYNKVESIKKYIKEGKLNYRVKRVKFVYGYTKKSMTFEVDSIEIGYGKPEWGADINEEYFVIKLGKKVKNGQR